MLTRCLHVIHTATASFAAIMMLFSIAYADETRDIKSVTTIKGCEKLADRAQKVLNANAKHRNPLQVFITLDDRGRFYVYSNLKSDEYDNTLQMLIPLPEIRDLSTFAAKLVDPKDLDSPEWLDISYNVDYFLDSALFRTKVFDFDLYEEPKILCPDGVVRQSGIWAGINDPLIALKGKNPNVYVRVPLADEINNIIPLMDKPFRGSSCQVLSLVEDDNIDTLAEDYGSHFYDIGNREQGYASQVMSICRQNSGCVAFLVGKVNYSEFYNRKGRSIGLSLDDVERIRKNTGKPIIILNCTAPGDKDFQKTSSQSIATHGIVDMLHKISKATTYAEFFQALRANHLNAVVDRSLLIDGRQYYEFLIAEDRNGDVEVLNPVGSILIQVSDKNMLTYLVPLGVGIICGIIGFALGRRYLILIGSQRSHNHSTDSNS